VNLFAQLSFMVNIKRKAFIPQLLKIKGIWNY
jgi:hypothetical protein